MRKHFNAGIHFMTSAQIYAQYGESVLAAKSQSQILDSQSLQISQEIV